MLSRSFAGYIKVSVESTILMHPKVFISHASEDKVRFVLGFAEKLRAAGIDAWLDRWEMLRVTALWTRSSKRACAKRPQ